MFTRGIPPLIRAKRGKRQDEVLAFCRAWNETPEK
jgi:hypothetical protein